MRHLLPRPPREVSKRGQILLVFGFIWCAIGFSVWQQPQMPGWENLLFSRIPTDLRAGAWVVTGLVAMAYALRPRTIPSDGIGFLALYIMPAERAAIFFWGSIDYEMTAFGGPGFSRGFFYGTVWLAIVAAVMICARWPDPPTHADLEAEQ